jgi:predicted CoA-substrate-specific enzyme activase
MPPPGDPPRLASGDSLAAWCERLARYYLRAAACPRMTGNGFVDHLLDEVAQRRLDALVIPVLKFCDTYHLAVDSLRRRLPAGFPLLLVEGDLTTGFGEQAVTRLEALVEQLHDGSGGGDAGRARATRRLAVGVDVGSTQVKAVLADDALQVLGAYLRPTTGRMSEACADAIEQLLGRAGISRDRVASVGVTGYGRKSVASDHVATEISCHARGVARFDPRPLTVVDVGGQDSKVIVTDGRGGVVRFTMNDKCAAGTGRFLDSMVRALALDFDAFSRLSIEAGREVPVSSMCSVFAESEVISLTARGEPLSGIARGINASIARRIGGMVRRLDGRPPFVLTGGVSQVAGFVRELERELGAEVEVLEYSPYAGAVGAALHALEAAG